MGRKSQSTIWADFFKNVGPKSGQIPDRLSSWDIGWPHIRTDNPVEGALSLTQRLDLESALFSSLGSQIKISHSVYFQS